MRSLLWVLTVLSLAAPARADDLGSARQEFRNAQRHEDYREREDAYRVLAGYDSRAAVEEALRALAREKNGAVIYTAVRCLALMKSTSAQEAYKEILTKGRSLDRLYVLMALDSMGAMGLTDALHGVLASKDAPAIAQAAMTLGRRQSIDSLPQLVPLLAHKDWQVRRGVAVALLALASPLAPVDPGSPDKPRYLPAPDVMRTSEVLGALVKALETGQGSDRMPVLRTLRKVTGQDFGLDVKAWKQLVGGTPADEVVHKPVVIPHAFGIPILGRRVVVVFDRSLRMDDPHPFRAPGRLEELCEVPGDAPIPSPRLTRKRQFSAAHIRRLFLRMHKKSRLEVVWFNNNVSRLFGKLVPPSAANRKLLKETLSGLKVDEGINVYGAMMEALNIAGAKESKAWKSGPDEIILISANVPTAGEVTDADVIASAVGLKARFRMVPIHTVGIDTHAYDMLKKMSAESGGTYLNLFK